MKNQKNIFNIEENIKIIENNGHKIILTIQKPNESHLAIFKKMNPRYLCFSQWYKSDFPNDTDGIIAKEMITKNIKSGTEIITIK